MINPKKPEKCHPVFDASAFYKGASLNSALVKGPDLLTNLIGVLIRFRQYPLALSANIVMIHRRRSDQKVQALRFYYRDPGTHEFHPFIKWTFNHLGRFVHQQAAHALRQAAEDGGDDGSEVTKQIVNHFYVDNLLTSFPTADEALQYAKKGDQYSAERWI